MLTKTENARINKELNKLIGEFKTSYEMLRKISEDKYKSTLKPYETFKPREGFYYDTERQLFNTECERFKEKAHALVDKAALEIIAENTKAPSTEAVNVVNLISARKEVSADEIDQLMTKYGHECPMVYKALHEKAVSLGYYDFKPHPINEAAENMEVAMRMIDTTFSANCAEHSIVTTPAALETTIARAFPAEE